MRRGLGFSGDLSGAGLIVRLVGGLAPGQFEGGAGGVGVEAAAGEHGEEASVADLGRQAVHRAGLSAGEFGGFGGEVARGEGLCDDGFGELLVDAVFAEAGDEEGAAGGLAGELGPDEVFGVAAVVEEAEVGEVVGRGGGVGGFVLFFGELSEEGRAAAVAGGEDAECGVDRGAGGVLGGSGGAGLAIGLAG